MLWCRLEEIDKDGEEVAHSTRSNKSENVHVLAEILGAGFCLFEIVSYWASLANPEFFI